MRSKLVFAVTLSLFVSLAAPAWAGSLAIYEDSVGPGVTALFGTGTGLVAGLHYDASTAEGGSLDYPATEITFNATGGVVFVDFDCQIAGCADDDWVLTATSLVVTDFSGGPVFGVVDIGDLFFDSALPGTLELSSCNYSSPSAPDTTCSPFTVAQTPEPGTGALLGFALAAVGFARRRRS